jgi:glycosyltransferase involved in cell wall biosynthesis
MSRSRRAVIFTQLDYRNFANTRTRFLVRQLRSDGFDVTMIALRHRPDPGRGWRVLTVSVQRFDMDGVALVEVTPLLATAPALGVTLMGIANPYESAGGLRVAVARVLSFAGVLRDFLVPISLLFAYIADVRGRFDVCISEGPWALVVGHLLRRLGRCDLHVADDYDYSPGIQSLSRMRGRLHERIEVARLRAADIVVCVGDLLAELRRAQTGRAVEVIENGIDTARFAAARGTRCARPTVAYCGAVEEWSGLDVVLQAWPQVLQQVPDAELRIAGHATPVYERHLRDVIGKCHLQHSVKLVGQIAHADVPAFLSGAHVGLAVFMPIPLRKYAFSLKVVEYMAAGLAVVATADTQSAHVVRQFDAGEVVEFDPVGIAVVLGKMLSSREVTDRYGRNGEAASSLFDWSVLMPKFTRLICGRLS